MRPRNASRNGAWSRRMKPASSTVSTPRSRSASIHGRSSSRRVRKRTGRQHQRFDAERRARSSTGASGRSVASSAIRPPRSPRRSASARASKLVPWPEASTASVCMEDEGWEPHRNLPTGRRSMGKRAAHRDGSARPRGSTPRRQSISFTPPVRARATRCRRDPCVANAHRSPRDARPLRGPDDRMDCVSRKRSGRISVDALHDRGPEEAEAPW